MRADLCTSDEIDPRGLITKVEGVEPQADFMVNPIVTACTIRLESSQLVIGDRLQRRVSGLVADSVISCRI
jgi:hypothetical protein